MMGVGQDYGVVYPAVTDVRTDIDYGTGGDDLTGTLAVCSQDVTTPALTTVAVDNAVTATFAGSDSGVTNYLLYRKPNAITWTDGGDRAGDGTIVVSGLDYNVGYIFCGYSDINDFISTPTQAIEVLMVEDTDNVIDSLQTGASAPAAMEAFGVPATYKPLGGGSRSIKARIIREGHPSMDGVPNSSSALMRIIVLNDTVTGISSSELDTGGDKITMPIRRGKVAMDRKIKKILNQDAGSMMLEVR